MAQRLPTLFKETKFFDTSIEDVTIVNAGEWDNSEVPCQARVNENGTTISTYTDSALIPSAQGPGYGQVIGNRYNLLKLSIRGEIHCVKSTGKADVNKSMIARLVLVLDTMSDGAQAQGEMIFTDWGINNSNIHSYLRMGGRPGRFQILDDQFHVIQHNLAVTDIEANQDITYGGETKQFQMDWIPPSALIVTLKGSTDSVGASELAKHNIFLLAYKTGTETNLVLSACSRAYYCE